MEYGKTAFLAASGKCLVVAMQFVLASVSRDRYPVPQILAHLQHGVRKPSLFWPQLDSRNAEYGLFWKQQTDWSMTDGDTTVL